MRSHSIVATILLLAACGRNPDADAENESRCSLGMPDAITLGEGERASLPLSFQGLASKLELVDPPPAWGAVLDESEAALRLRVPYGASGSQTFTVRQRCGTAEHVARATVTIRPMKWGRPVTWAAGSTEPEEREHAMLWISPTAPDRLEIFGGYGFHPAQYTVISDHWGFDLKNGGWSGWAPTGDVPHVASSRVAVLPDGTVYLLDGSTQDDDFPGELHRLKDGAWSTIRRADTPITSLGALVYDAKQNRLVSVGGYNGAISLDVATLSLADDASGWNVATVAPGPSDRYGYAFGYDEPNERLIVATGAQYPKFTGDVNPATDTWSLDLSVWPPVWSRIPGEIEGRRNACWAVDDLQHRLFLWSGTPDARTSPKGVWVLDLEKGAEQWTKLELPDEPTPRGSCSGVFDRARNRVVFGFGNDISGAFRDLQFLEL